MKFICLIWISTFCISDVQKCTAQNVPYLKIIKYRISPPGIERQEYCKIFDSKNNLLIYREGDLNVTDSIIYKYNSENKLIDSEEFLPDSKGKLYLNDADGLPNYQGIENYSFELSDTFKLLKDSPFYEIDDKFKDSLKVSQIESDSGLVQIYKYRINKKIFILMPLLSDNQSKEDSGKLDKVELVMNQKRLLEEKYYFRQKEISRSYYYNKGRLIKIKTETSGYHNGIKGYEEIFKYDYLNPY